MRTRAVCCIFTGSLVLGADVALANSQLVCPPHCYQHPQSPRLPTPPRRLVPPSLPQNAYAPPRVLTPPRVFPGRPATAVIGTALAGPSKVDLKPNRFIAVRPGFANASENNWSPASQAQSTQNPSQVAGSASGQASPRFVVQQGFTSGSEANSSLGQNSGGPPPASYQPSYVQQGYATPTYGSITPSAYGQVGYSPQTSEQGASAPQAAGLQLPDPSTNVAQQLPSADATQATSSPTTTEPQSSSLSQAPSPDTSFVAYACHTTLGVCPVVFSSPPQAGSACLCIDASSGRRDQGEVQ